MLLVLILISGQTWAFYQAYDMAGQMDAMSVKSIQSEQTSSANMMMHHLMDTQSADNNMECCQMSEECQCPANACQTMQILMPLQSHTPDIESFVITWPKLDGIFLNNLETPLYRPPII